jgi:hypothetical protein
MRLVGLSFCLIGAVTVCLLCEICDGWHAELISYQFKEQQYW